MLLSVDTNQLPSVRFFGHVNYKSPWVHFSRIADEYILYIVQSGTLYIKEGATEYALSKGGMLLLEPGIKHYGHKPSCCHYFYIHFKHPAIQRLEERPEKEILDEMLRKREISFDSELYSDDTGIDSLTVIPKYYTLENTDYYMQFLYGVDDDFFKKYEHYKRLVSCKLLELLIRIGVDYLNAKSSHLSSQIPRAFLKARKIMNYIHTDYRSKITSKEIEEKFETSYDYINKIFFKMTGQTISNFINIVRIQKARQLIETSSLKYSEIAYFVGIDDPYYFSKLFKKYTGLTPSQYSEKHSRKPLIESMNPIE